ncbi:MAG: Fe-S cluster assembly protein SufB, partial [Thaumarchaeota archaeon]|nr:Fe-S cluster assembly protein SufB [Nitrososphaerota archaeon]
MATSTEIVTDDYKTKYGFADSTPYLQHEVKGISEAVIKEISRIRDEPQWMEEFRLKAYKHFIERPVPTWGVDLSPIKFDDFYYYAQPAKQTAKKWEDVPAEIRNTFEKLGIPEAERKFLAGVGAIYESQEVYNSLQADLKKQGVIFTSVGNAVKEYPDLIRKYMGSIVPPNDNKFAALNSAVWSDGPFIYIPEGVKIQMPLQSYFRINAQGMGQFERTLIVAEPGSEVQYIEGCLPAEELVSTGQTFAPIESLGLHDSVVSHTGRLALVTKRFIHPYTGVMLTIVPQSKGNSFRLTPEHPVLCVKRDSVAYGRSRNNWHRRVSTRKLEQAEPRYVPAGEVEVGDFLAYVAPSESVDDSLFTQPILKILGLYLAEGSVSFNRKLNLDVLQFSFGKSRREGRLARELVSLIRSLGQKASVHKSRGAFFSVVSYSRNLIDLCAEHCGIGAATKTLSEKIMKLPPEKQEVLIRYYLKGDGNRYLKNPHPSMMIRSSTASPTLAYQVQEILARNGIFANISTRKGSKDKIGGRPITRRTQYVVQFTEDKRWSEVRRRSNLFFVPVRKIEKGDFDELVYNLEVERDNSYLVRGFAVHNCTAAMYDKSMLHAAVVE